MNAPSQHDKLPPAGLLLLAALALGWGINWPVMKIVLSEVPPLYFRAISLILGGSGLLVIARASGYSIAIPPGQFKVVAQLSLFNIIGWNVFAIYGVSLLPSGRAALLGFTMPVWGAILSVLILGERLNVRRIAALVLGLSGIVALMGGSISGFLEAPAGIACMLAAAWSWAFGIVMFKRKQVPMPTVALTGWTMFLGGIPLFLAALPLETARLTLPSFWPAAGLAYNTIIAFMFCYWAWNKIVLMVPVSVSSLSSLATPLIGVISGMLILGEPIGAQELLAAALILSAVATVSIRS
ncbi:EamA family transporter [uncultured Propionivibrio sp.]|uniref:DMT family transporter n=1 Tax=uncultured Propionivibrio sp. TaxID=426737 RepID=UPI0029C002A3|nr:EamA family transporter [uncultured Propionivibrio sp.]